MVHTMKHELIFGGLLVLLTDHYTNRGTLPQQNLVECSFHLAVLDQTYIATSWLPDEILNFINSSFFFFFFFFWIARNRTVLTYKLCTFAKLNYLKYNCFHIDIVYCPVDWGCRIHQLHLCRGVILPPNECPGYDTKQSDGEVPVMLELWECGISLHCHCSQVHSDPEWWHLKGTYLWVK